MQNDLCSGTTYGPQYLRESNCRAANAPASNVIGACQAHVRARTRAPLEPPPGPQGLALSLALSSLPLPLPPPLRPSTSTCLQAGFLWGLANHLIDCVDGALHFLPDDLQSRAADASHRLHDPREGEQHSGAINTLSSSSSSSLLLSVKQRTTASSRKHGNRIHLSSAHHP